MDLKRYEKTRYQNIYRHKKNKNYIVEMSNPKTSISLIDNKRIVNIEDAKKIRDDYKLKIVKTNQIIITNIFDEVWDKYIYNCKEIQKQSYNTLKKKQIFYNCWYKTHFSNERINKIKREDIVDFINQVDTSDKEKNELLKRLKPFFNWCVEENYLIKSPAFGIKPIKVKKVEMKYWITSQFKQFMICVNNDIINGNTLKIKYKAYIAKMIALIGFNLGNRIGETRALYFGTFSDKNLVVEIMHSIDYDPNSENYLGNTKNYSSERIIDISEKLFMEIQEYKNFLINEMGFEIDETTLLFYNHGLKKPYSDTQLRKIFNYYINTANVPKIRMYDLRHTFVATMMEEGWELYHISPKLGHTNYSTTVNKYGHLTTKVRQELARTTDKYY